MIEYYKLNNFASYVVGRSFPGAVFITKLYSILDFHLTSSKLKNKELSILLRF